MPLAALIGPALSVGASLLGASSAKKAAAKTDAANQQAAREALAAQQANFDRIVGLNQPFIEGGNTAQQALMGRLGLTQPAQPMNPGGGGQAKAPGGCRRLHRGQRAVRLHIDENTSAALTHGDADPFRHALAGQRGPAEDDRAVAVDALQFPAQHGKTVGPAEQTQGGHQVTK